jgi:hypothetical protein
MAGAAAHKDAANHVVMNACLNMPSVSGVVGIALLLPVPHGLRMGTAAAAICTHTGQESPSIPAIGHMRMGIDAVHHN